MFSVLSSFVVDTLTYSAKSFDYHSYIGSEFIRQIDFDEFLIHLESDETVALSCVNLRVLPTVY